MFGSFEDFADQFMSDEELDAAYGFGEPTLPSSSFMDKVFGPVEPTKPQEPKTDSKPWNGAFGDDE